MISLEALEKEIEEFRAQIKIREAMIRVYKNGQAKQGDPSLRFYMRRPLDAVRLLLAESGGSMKRNSLEKALGQGGISVGRKRGDHNVRISINTNVANGNLREATGTIYLPTANE